MLKPVLVNLKKIGRTLKKIPRPLAEKSFLAFLGLFFIVLLLGLLIFYRFYFALPKDLDKVIIKEEPFKIDTDSQQKVFQEWQKRNENFQTADFKEYPDLFK